MRAGQHPPGLPAPDSHVATSGQQRATTSRTPGMEWIAQSPKSAPSAARKPPSDPVSTPSKSEPGRRDVLAALTGVVQDRLSPLW